MMNKINEINEYEKNNKISDTTATATGNAMGDKEVRTGVDTKQNVDNKNGKNKNGNGNGKGGGKKRTKKKARKNKRRKRSKKRRK